MSRPVEPEDFGWWRRFVQTLGVGSQDHEGTQSPSALWEGQRWVLDWAAPFPYQDWALFRNQQISELRILDIPKLHRVFEWWQQNGPALRPQHYRQGETIRKLRGKDQQKMQKAKLPIYLLAWLRVTSLGLRRRQNAKQAIPLSTPKPSPTQVGCSPIQRLDVRWHSRNALMLNDTLTAFIFRILGCSIAVTVVRHSNELTKWAIVVDERTVRSRAKSSSVNLDCEESRHECQWLQFSRCCLCFTFLCLKWSKPSSL